MTESISLTGNLPQDILSPLAGAAAGEREDSDAQLIIASKHNCEAYATLYRRYANSVYRYMLVCVVDEQDAQDLTAQTFLAGLEGVQAYQGRGTFAAWLFSIARRKVMDFYRHSQPHIPFDELIQVPHPEQQPDQIVEERCDYERLTRAIRTLAPDRAEAIRLRIFAELSVNEIGEAMGRNESAVRMLLSRALHDLRLRLNSTSPSFTAR